MSSLPSFIDRSPLLARIWSWKPHVFEASLYLGFYFAYVLTRGLVYSDTREIGIENAARIISAERALGIFWEPGWQSWAIEHARALVIALNWVYVVTYWPVILAVAFVLYLIRRNQYYFYRSVVMVNLAAALLVFMLFPVASPFANSSLLVDSIRAYGPSYYGSPEMATYYNINAAMPSLHFSWTVILGVFYIRNFKGWFKAAGVLYPITTFFAVTLTANHFILDVVAGGALAGLSFAAVWLMQQQKALLARFRRKAMRAADDGDPVLSLSDDRATAD